MKLPIVGLVFGVVCAACGSSPDGENAQSTSAESVAAVADLAGAYSGGTGAQFEHLVLDREVDATGHYGYFLEDKPGLISCSVNTGCTITHTREDGTYSATATHLTLEPTSGAKRVYTYVHTGNALTLSRSGETGPYTALPSYCELAADCPEQGLIRPYCASKTSGWECNANVCSYACSM